MKRNVNGKELERAEKIYNELNLTEKMSKDIGNIVFKKFIIPNLPDEVKNDETLQESIKNDGLAVEESEKSIKETISFLEKNEELDFFEGKVFLDTMKLSLIDAALTLINAAKFDKEKDTKVILQEAFDYLKQLVPYDISTHTSVAEAEKEIIERYFKSEEDIKRERWEKVFSDHNKPKNNLENFLNTGTMTDELIEDLKTILKEDNSGKNNDGLYFATFVMGNDILNKIATEYTVEKEVIDDYSNLPSSIEEKYNTANTLVFFQEDYADILRNAIFDKYQRLIDFFEYGKDQLPDMIKSNKDLKEKIEASKGKSSEELIKVIIMKMNPYDFKIEILRDETEDKFGHDILEYLESYRMKEGKNTGSKYKEVLINMTYSKMMMNLFSNLVPEEMEAREGALSIMGNLIPFSYNIRYNLLGMEEDEISTPYTILQNNNPDFDFVPYVWSCVQGFYDDFLKEADKKLGDFNNLKESRILIKNKIEEAYNNNRKAFYANFMNNRFTTSRNTIEDTIIPLTLMIQWNVCCKAYSMKMQSKGALEVIKKEIEDAMKNPEKALILTEKELKEILNTKDMEEKEATEILSKYSGKMISFNKAEISPQLAAEFESYLLARQGGGLRGVKAIDLSSMIENNEEENVVIN